MITLKPFLYGQETQSDKSAPPSEVETVIACYRSALNAFGKGAAQDNSAHGVELERILGRLEQRIAAKPTADAVARIGKHVLSQVEHWGDTVAEVSKAQADEIKELLSALGKTAETVGSRDRTNNETFQELTGRLERVAGLSDLTQIKATLVKHVAELRDSVDQMARDNQQLVTQLKAQLVAYEHKLKSAEDIAFKDELTGIPNRRYIQRQIAWNIRHKEPFCVVMLDLNGFKLVNDKYGHHAGDDLLRQFASELRVHTRASDLIGRWGGDEFIVIMMSSPGEAHTYIERIKYWVFGKYVVKIESGPEERVLVDAAVGLAEWQGGMTESQVIALADTSMYADKRSSRKAR